MQRHTNRQNAPSDTCPHHLLICLVVVRKKGSSCGIQANTVDPITPICLTRFAVSLASEATTRDLWSLSVPRAKSCKAKKPLQETCKGYTRLCQVPSGSWDGAKMATLKQSHHQRHDLSHRIRCLHSHQQQVPHAHQEHIENGSL